MRILGRYGVVDYEHGFVVTGTSVPVDDLNAIMAARGCTQKHTQACMWLGAANYLSRCADVGPVVMVIANSPGALAAWRVEIEANLATIEDPIERWRCGLDTGLSSIAIYNHMMGGVTSGAAGSLDRFPYPRDADDLGRCLRLLDVAPEWAARIGEMAQRGREWAALVASWDELRDLCRQSPAACSLRMNEILEAEG